MNTCIIIKTYCTHYLQIQYLHSVFTARNLAVHSPSRGVVIVHVQNNRRTAHTQREHSVAGN